MKPQTTLCSLKANESVHVLVSYRPGTLKCFVNGKQVVDTGHLGGDFSNWTPQHFLLGDEFEDHRYWAGEINRLAIHARFIDGPEAAKRYQLIKEESL